MIETNSIKTNATITTHGTVITSISISAFHYNLIQKAKEIGLFTSNSEAIRYCINLYLRHLIKDYKTVQSKEFIKIDDKYVRIIKRME